MPERKVHFTRHARERWAERFGPLVKQAGGNVARSLATEFYSAKPDGSIRNNTRFLTGLYERYGYDGPQFEFRVSDNAVFICRDGSLITVYEKSGSMFEGRTSRYGR